MNFRFRCDFDGLATILPKIRISWSTRNFSLWIFSSTENWPDYITRPTPWGREIYYNLKRNVWNLKISVELFLKSIFEKIEAAKWLWHFFLQPLVSHWWFCWNPPWNGSRLVSAPFYYWYYSYCSSTDPGYVINYYEHLLSTRQKNNCFNIFLKKY